MSSSVSPAATTRARASRRPGINSSGSIVIVTRSSGSRPRRTSSAATLLTVVSITSIWDDMALAPWTPNLGPCRHSVKPGRNYPLVPSMPMRNRRSASALAVVVEAHVEGFDGLRVVHHDDRLLRVFLGQTALELRLQVDAPIDRELQVLVGPLEHLDHLAVIHMHEFRADDPLEFRDQPLLRCAGRRRRDLPVFRSVTPRTRISAALPPMPHCPRGRRSPARSSRTRQGGGWCSSSRRGTR